MKIKMHNTPLFDPDSVSMKASIGNLAYEKFKDFHEQVMGEDEVDFYDALTELKNVKTILDPDPTDLGLSSINRKLKEIQGHKDRIAFMLTNAYTVLGKWEEFEFMIERYYNHNKNTFLAREDIKELRNKELQTAAAEARMPLIIKAQNYCALQIKKIKNFLKQIDLVYNNLKSTNDNLSRQITVIQMQININEIARKM